MTSELPLHDLPTEIDARFVSTTIARVAIGPLLLKRPVPRHRSRSQPNLEYDLGKGCTKGPYRILGAGGQRKRVAR